MLDIIKELLTIDNISILIIHKNKDETPVHIPVARKKPTASPASSNAIDPVKSSLEEKFYFYTTSIRKDLQNDLKVFLKNQDFIRILDENDLTKGTISKNYIIRFKDCTLDFAKQLTEDLIEDFKKKQLP